MCSYLHNLKILEAETDKAERRNRKKPTTVFGDFNTSLQVIDKISRQKISKNIEYGALPVNLIIFRKQ